MDTLYILINDILYYQHANNSPEKYKNSVEDFYIVDIYMPGTQASFNTNHSFSGTLTNFVNIYPGSKLGGGLPGFIPQALITTNNNKV